MRHLALAFATRSVSCAATPTPTVLPMISGDGDVVRLRSGEAV